MGARGTGTLNRSETLKEFYSGYSYLKLTYLVLIFFVSNHRPVSVRIGTLFTGFGFRTQSAGGI
jgi:hypothetical protein